MKLAPRSSTLAARHAVAALAAVVLFVACSSDGADVDTAIDTTTSSTPAVSAPGTPVEPVAEAPAPPDCVPPFSPVTSVDQYSGATGGLPAIEGADTFIPLQAPRSIDTDADGRDDQIRPKSVLTDPAVLERGDGRLRFEREGLIASITAVGDVDGDGRDDLGVSLTDDAAQSAQEQRGAYLVPGSTPPGTHDPADVGIRVDGAVIAIGDRDGDGISELLEQHGDEAITTVLPGRAIAALDPPADAREVTPLLVVPGVALGLADLGREVPALVTGELIEAPAAGVLHLADEDGDRRFTTAPEPWVVGYTSTFAAPSVRVSNRGTFLVLSQAERSAARAYLWRVDDPCAPAAG